MATITEPVLWEGPLAVIGEEDKVAGFQALGFKVYPLKPPAEFKDILEQTALRQCVVCLVQDDVYRREEERINSYRNVLTPVFIPFSSDVDLSAAKPQGELEKIMQAIRLRATGTY